MKQYEEALTYYNKACEIMEAVCGKEHNDTADIYSNIARIYQEHRKLTEEIKEKIKEIRSID